MSKKLEAVQTFDIIVRNKTTLDETEVNYFSEFLISYYNKNKEYPLLNEWEYKWKVSNDWINLNTVIKND